MAVITRQSGLVPLAELAELIDERPLPMGLELAADGTEPELIQTMIETQGQTLMHYLETKYRMVLDGVMSIQSGDNPLIVGQKLRNFYAD